MNDQGEPDWDLLHIDPWAFFGLEPGADTKTLKRSYNRLIRKYKPEKFPEEFKKIRAGYETINNRMRYAERHQSDGETSQFDWSSLVTPNANSDSIATDKPQSDVPPVEEVYLAEEVVYEPTLLERLETEPIGSIIEEIKSTPEKSPRDYYNLAILDGMEASTGDGQFENWLLRGISDYPYEPGLNGLFRSYLKTHLAADRLSEVLLAAVAILPSDRFFQLTEPAWDRLIREREFTEFRNTLATCERRLDTTSNDSTLIFYLRMLKPAIWKADDQWLKRIIGELEDQYYQLSDWAMQDFEFLNQLFEYRQIERGSTCGVLRADMNRVLELWCMDLDGSSDQAVVDCQYKIAENGRQLLHEFPAESSIEELIVVWTHVVEEVSLRQGSVVFDQSQTGAHAFSFMARATRRTARGFKYNFGTWVASVGMGIALLAVIVAIMFLVRLVVLLSQGQWWGLLDIVWALLTLAAGAVAGYFIVLGGMTIRELKYELIRGELLKLIRVIPVEPYALSSVLEGAENEKFSDGIEVMDADEVVTYLVADPAMHIYAAAQKLLHCERDTLDLDQE